ncbi:MAG: DNA recombination protein RmuC [Candidatus Omnitrophota bacterium]|nr:DNA recombination protein RmuC [Candidatus Omnitrophota bacterium]
MREIWLIIFSIFNTLILIPLLILFYRARNNANISQNVISIKENQERIERAVKEEISQNRDEMRKSLKSFEDSVLSRMKENENSQKNQLDTFLKQLSSLTQMNEQKLEKIRETVQEGLKTLQEENAQKLEQMRLTVDEKLHSTLDRRLGESFKLVSEQLKAVQEGFGEMRNLATGVGDLKKVLSNIKTRGIWGEMQLSNLLEQILTAEQYASNVITKKGSNERVEFAIRLPGRDKDEHEQVWLPIDAKFPQEDYQRLLDAQEQANPDLLEKAARQLEMRIKAEAKDIKEKYLDPPHTTDFGIMFLPTEALYAEVLRIPGLAELLQREYRVVVTGPMNLVALLNSLQMGFRTLAIEKRTSEVWKLLATVKTEFAKFGDMLDKTHKKLQEASTTIEDASKKSRTIERTLRIVHELPSSQPDKTVIEYISEDAHENKSESSSQG